MGIVKRDSITITVLSYVGVIIGFVNKILLFPNFLDEEMVGLTGILLTIALMYAQFSALGITSSVVRFFPFFRTPDRKNNGLFFWSALGISVGFLFFTLLFLIFREPVTQYYSVRSPLLSEYYMLLIPLALTTLFYNFYSSWLQALSRTVLSSGVYDIVLRLLTTAAISVYALGVIDIEQFILTYVLVHFVPTLILLIYTAAIGESYAKPVITPRTRRLLSIFFIYGIWQFFGTASTYLIPVIDQAMLAGMQGLAENGVYVVMLYMVSTMIIPYRSVVKVATPLVSGYWKSRDMVSMARIYRSSSLTSLIVGCGVFLLIWVNLGNIFSLMPESYEAGRYVFLFLGIGRIVDMYAGLNGIILVTSKKYRYDFVFSILLVIMTVFTNLMFIPRFGMTGAALATMITLVVLNLVRVAFVWKFYRMHPFAWSDLVVMLITVVVAAGNMLLPSIGGFFTDAAVRSVAVAAVFGGAVYLGKFSPELNGMADKLLKRLKRSSGRQ